MALIPHAELMHPRAASIPSGERSSPEGAARPGRRSPEDAAGDPGRESLDPSSMAPEAAAGRAAGPATTVAPQAPPGGLLSQGFELSLLALVLAARGDASASDSRPSPSAGVTGEALPGIVMGGPHARAEVSRSPRAASSCASAHAAPRGAEDALRAGAAGTRLVERGLAALLQQRGGQLIMRLSPPELGVLEIRMRFEAGRVEVLFRPSTLAARELLEGSLGMLRQSLTRHVGVGRLAVEPPALLPPEDRAAVEAGHSFDAGGRESRGRQEAQRELRWRTEADLVFGRSLRPNREIASMAAEGRASCSSHLPAAPPASSFPAASAS